VLATLVVAAVPTAATLVVEWLALAPVSSLARFATALPLGAAVLAALVGAVVERRR
jgi:hypothetical protein